MGQRPRLLDLFCCAGGAAMGYHRAGFEVVGVDIKSQPRYPFEFVRADVKGLSDEFLAGFDVVHASPPCQGYTELRHAPGAVGAPRMIAEVRERLRATRRPYVIENVPGAAADMIFPMRLHGEMFGLGAQGCKLQRDRLFESNVFLTPPQDWVKSNRPVIGVYGGHARKRSAKAGGRGTKDVWVGGHRAAAAEALGIDWMTLAEMSESIPPAYTQWIGEQLIAHLSLATPDCIS